MIVILSRFWASMDHMCLPFVFEKLVKQMTHVDNSAPTIESYEAAYAKKTADILPQTEMQKEISVLVTAVRHKEQRQTRSAARKEAQWADRDVHTVVFGKQMGRDSPGHFCYCHNENGSDFCD